MGSLRLPRSVEHRPHQERARERYSKTGPAEGLTAAGAPTPPNGSLFGRSAARPRYEAHRRGLPRRRHLASPLGSEPPLPRRVAVRQSETRNPRLPTRADGLTTKPRGSASAARRVCNDGEVATASPAVSRRGEFSARTAALSAGRTRHERKALCPPRRCQRETALETPPAAVGPLARPVPPAPPPPAPPPCSR